MVETGSRVIIVDNISWICNRAESGDAAGMLMQLLIGLKKRRGLSILVLAARAELQEHSLGNESQPPRGKQSLKAD